MAKQECIACGHVVPVVGGVLEDHSPIQDEAHSELVCVSSGRPAAEVAARLKQITEMRPSWKPTVLRCRACDAPAHRDGILLSTLIEGFSVPLCPGCRRAWDAGELTWPPE